jgi:hypothetical protein
MSPSGEIAFPILQLQISRLECQGANDLSKPAAPANI